MMKVDKTLAAEAAADREAQRAVWDDGGKEAINQLLWRFLPGNVTLDRAEEIACDIHTAISKEWMHPDGATETR